MCPSKRDNQKERAANIGVLHQAIRPNGLKGGINGAGLKIVELCAELEQQNLIRKAGFVAWDIGKGAFY